MCRILLVRSQDEFSPEIYLSQFALICRNSKEYQGHGWGCSALSGNEWKHYRNILPVWEDDLGKFPKTKLLVAHARSAFRDEGIEVENNMPFHDERFTFAFNGELRGVRINAEGRIGAEKIFNYVKRFYKGDMKEAIEKAVDVIRKRTKYIRAMNFIIADACKVYVYTLFSEDEDYFTLTYSAGQDLIICSEKIPSQLNPLTIPNNTLMAFL